MLWDEGELDRSALWRRHADTAVAIDVSPDTTLSNHFARPGGSAVLLTRQTPTTGREPHLFDLLPRGIPMCNTPNTVLPDMGNVSDSIVVLPDGLLATTA